MIPLKSIALIFVCISVINCQRPSFAGPRPQSGYKDRFKPDGSGTNVTVDLSGRVDEDLLSNQTQRPPVFVNVVTPDANATPLLGDRIDPNPVSNSNLPVNANPTTSERLPYDALGDKELVDRLNRLPADQKPFWLLNAHAIEANRNRTSSGVSQQQPQQNVNQQQLQQLLLLQQQQQQQGPSLAQRLPLPQNSNSGSQANQAQLAINRPEVDAAILQTLSTDLLLQVLSSRLQSSTANPIAQRPIGAVSGDNLIDFETRADDDNQETTIAPNTAGFPNYGNLP